MSRAVRSWTPFWARSLVADPKGTFLKTMDSSKTPCQNCIQIAKNLLFADMDELDAEEIRLSKEAWAKLDKTFSEFKCGSSAEYQAEVYDEQLAASMMHNNWR